MIIYLEDLKTIVEEKDCDMNKGKLVFHTYVEFCEPVYIYVLYTKKELLEFEKQDIEKWFETEYRETFEKCIRRIHMGIKMSDDSNPQDILEKLYLLAEEKASEIRRLEKLIQREK